MPKETLIALAVHHAIIPHPLKDKKLSQIVKDFVGAGVPRDAQNTLLLEDHEITLVFSGILINRNELSFQFTWPASLVDQTGKCRGKAELTLVYSPPVDRAHGGNL